jgi:cell division protein FtsB
MESIRRSHKKKWHHHPIFLFLLFVILIIVIRGAYQSFVKKSKAQAQYEQFYQEYQELQQKKESLDQDIERLGTERGREEEYRERFNAVREGEQLIRIIEDEASQQ